MAENKRRNIVLIMCDQLRPDFLSCYGADFIPTPNIDELARNGVVFDNAITASTVCAPARAAMITGKFVSGHDAWTNDIPCRPGTEYLPQRMSAAGYLTAAVGCYDHTPRSDSFGYRYRRLFDENRPDSEYTEWLRERHPEVTSCWASDESGLQFKYPEDEFYDAWSADKAIEFINAYAKKQPLPEKGKIDDTLPPLDEDAPFYMYCGFLSPHTPVIPPKERRGSVDIDKIPKVLCTHREDIAPVEKNRRAFLNSHEDLINPEGAVERRMYERRAYCELIVEIDRLVGKIVSALKENGLYENTTIIFTSDHGSVDNDYNVVSKGPWPYKSQLFIPMVIANHPRLAPGAHCDALCGNLDIGATVLDIAGDERAFGTSHSMLGLFDGAVAERETNMSEFCDSVKTIVDKRYTFTYYPFTGQTCLYDREADPLETTDISGRPDLADMERRFLMEIIDNMILAKGVRMEAHDMVNEVRQGIEKKDPKFLDNFDIAYPIASMREIERLREAGLPDDINEFCRTRPIMAHYGAYFLEKKD